MMFPVNVKNDDGKVIVTDLTKTEWEVEAGATVDELMGLGFWQIAEKYKMVMMKKD